MATLDAGYWRRAQAVMEGMIAMADDVVKGQGPAFSGGIADELGGQRFLDEIYGRHGGRLCINHWGDRSTWDAHFAKLKAYVQARLKLVVMRGVFWSIADQARFEDLWAAMVENIKADPRMQPHADILSQRTSGYSHEANYDPFMAAYFAFLEDFLGTWSTVRKGARASKELYLQIADNRVASIAGAITRGMELRVFGAGQESLLRWWSDDIREQIPLVQFEHLRLLSMFNVAGHVQRIGDWHVAKITNELVHPDIGPIEYFVAFRAGADADLFTSGIRVFSTRGTLADQDDSSITYPGWAKLNDAQEKLMNDLLAMDISTPERRQDQINALNAMMTQGTNDYIPWTTFINPDTDGTGHTTSSFVDLIPDT